MSLVFESVSKTSVTDVTVAAAAEPIGSPTSGRLPSLLRVVVVRNVMPSRSYMRRVRTRAVCGRTCLRRLSITFTNAAADNTVWMNRNRHRGPFRIAGRNFMRYFASGVPGRYALSVAPRCDRDTESVGRDTDGHRPSKFPHNESTVYQESMKASARLFAAAAVAVALVVYRQRTSWWIVALQLQTINYI